MAMRGVFFLMSFSDCQSYGPTDFAGLRGFAYPMNNVRLPSTNFSVTRLEREKLSPLSSAATSEFYVSLHDSPTGEIDRLIGGFSFADDAGTPGCNGALDPQRRVWYKTDIVKKTFVNGTCPSGCKSGSHCCLDPTEVPEPPAGTCFDIPCNQLSAGGGLGDGQILTIDVATGRVASKVTMTGSPHHSPALAWHAHKSLAYGIVPYTYTAYGIFSYNPITGAVEEMKTLPKQNSGGIGDCIAGVLPVGGRSLLYYVLAEGHSGSVVFFDVDSLEEYVRMPGWTSMLVLDPAHPGTLLGLVNAEPGVRLVRLDPAANTSTTLYTQRKTTLGTDMRCQDQASFAINDDGTSIWFASSYNTERGELWRGIFHLAIDTTSDQVSLVSEKPFFGEPDKNITFIGKIDWFSAQQTLVV